MRITQLSRNSQVTLHKAEWRVLGAGPHDPILMEVVHGGIRLRRAPGTPR
jgi:hypothetical protein